MSCRALSEGARQAFERGRRYSMDTTLHAPLAMRVVPHSISKRASPSDVHTIRKSSRSPGAGRGMELDRRELDDATPVCGERGLDALDEQNAGHDRTAGEVAREHGVGGSEAGRDADWRRFVAQAAMRRRELAEHRQRRLVGCVARDRVDEHQGARKECRVDQRGERTLEVGGGQVSAQRPLRTAAWRRRQEKRLRHPPRRAPTSALR